MQPGGEVGGKGGAHVVVPGAKDGSGRDDAHRGGVHEDAWKAEQTRGGGITQRAGEDIGPNKRKKEKERKEKLLRPTLRLVQL